MFEPHFDAILTFWDRIGLGANLGYMKPIGDGQRGVPLGGELMVGITPRFVLRALGGYVTGSVSHSFGFDTQTYDASGARFGGRIFYVIARSTHFDVAVAVDILRVSGSRETLPSGEALEYEGTGGSSTSRSRSCRERAQYRQPPQRPAGQPQQPVFSAFAAGSRAGVQHASAAATSPSRIVSVSALTTNTSHSLPSGSATQTLSWRA